MSSSWTGRAARSLDEAFGPHTSHAICEPSPHVVEAWNARRERYPAKPKASLAGRVRRLLSRDR